MDKKTKIWLMRQAGRYLPEYQEIRKKEKNFMNLCFNPKLACDISLQPIERFDFDFIILFSDILVIPYALGQEVKFKESIGPILGNINYEQLEVNLSQNLERLAPVFETIKLIKQKKKEKDLIGFCGGPFTVLNYMIEQGTSKTHEKIKKFIKSNNELSEKIIKIITDISIEYLKKQIDSGADVIKVFDSWAGLLDGDLYKKYIIEPNKEIAKEIKNYSPGTKQIFFPRGSKENYFNFIKEVKPDVISLDEEFPDNVFSYAKKNDIILQGNLKPTALIEGGRKLKKGIKNILNKFKENKHIFNLSHGVLPQTPVENVEILVEIIRNYNET
ncbi:MAG: uroporphyrinogen decarboxylase [Alphaproteobacteria bacterium]